MATKSKALVHTLLAFSLAGSVSCAIGVSNEDLADSAAANIADPADQGADDEQDAGDEDEGVILEPVKPDAGGKPDSGGGDAGAKDAGAQDAGTRDAGQSGGSALDAGGDASAGGGSLDAGATTDAGASNNDAGTDAGRDAGRDSGSTGGGSAGGGGSCNPSTCETCLVVGPFPCCRDNGTCGCTWAPGAYCM